MQIVIDIQDDVYRVLKEDIYPIPDTERLALVFKTLVKKGTPLPDNATNGDVIKAMFPYHDIEVNEQKNYVHVFYDRFYTTYPLRWWLEPYKAGDTDGKNNS